MPEFRGMPCPGDMTLGHAFGPCIWTMYLGPFSWTMYLGPCISAMSWRHGVRPCRAAMSCSHVVDVHAHILYALCFMLPGGLAKGARPHVLADDGLQLSASHRPICHLRGKLMSRPDEPNLPQHRTRR